MIKAKHIAFIICVCCVFTAASQRSGVNGQGWRFFVGPALGIYSINQNHAQNAVPKTNLLAGFRKEFRAGRDYKLFFMAGADYFYHGVGFKSYYFDQDTLQIYDKNFAYDYDVIFHEVNVPLQFRYSFFRENNSMFTPYVVAGYHLRFMLPANVKISQEGNKIRSSSEEIRFRNKIFANNMNAFLSAGIGWQKNTINKAKAGFFVELHFRYGFSQYFFQTNYSASSLYINGAHVGLVVGVKV